MGSGRKPNDLTGRRFGKLTAVRMLSSKGHARWECDCDCGGTTVARSCDLVSGSSRSCGCLKLELLRGKPPNLIEVPAGSKFGRLTVLERNGGAVGKPEWLCRCDCGNTISVAGTHLRTGTSRSCGCLQREVMSRASLKHGMHGTPTYITWKSMIDRCENENHPGYSHYGGRGITICDRWRESFENFLADMGVRPSGKTIDRINVNGGYEKSNCRWATDVEQARNKRSVKLDEQKAEEIRARLASGEQLKPVASDYGISFQTASAIKHGKLWVKRGGK